MASLVIQSELRFDYFCCNCLQPSNKDSLPGKVLSCCDFLCHSCGEDAREPYTCPGCRKVNVKILSIGESALPREVVNNLSDTGNSFSDIISALQFQRKHYKTMVMRVVAKANREKNELLRYLMYITSKYLYLSY